MLAHARTANYTFTEFTHVLGVWRAVRVVIANAAAIERDAHPARRHKHTLCTGELSALLQWSPTGALSLLDYINISHEHTRFGANVAVGGGGLLCVCPCVLGFSHVDGVQFSGCHIGQRARATATATKTALAEKERAPHTHILCGAKFVTDLRFKAAAAEHSNTHTHKHKQLYCEQYT